MAAKLIQFGDDQAEALEADSSRLGESQAHIVRESYRLFRTALREAGKGNQIGVIRDGQVVSVLFGPWSDAEPMRA